MYPIPINVSVLKNASKNSSIPVETPLKELKTDARI